MVYPYDCYVSFLFSSEGLSGSSTMDLGSQRLGFYEIITISL